MNEVMNKFQTFQGTRVPDALSQTKRIRYLKNQGPAVRKPINLIQD